MTDTTNETGPDDIRLDMSFYPIVGTEEDERGMVEQKGVLRNVAFGMGDRPRLLIEAEAEDETLVLKITAGDIDLAETDELLQMALMGVQQAMENHRRASADLN